MASAHGSAQDVTCWTAVDLKTLDWARADAPISEMGQSRRFRPVSVRSDLPLTADIGRRTNFVAMAHKPKFIATQQFSALGPT
jgi:hypothetical protein